MDGPPPSSPRRIALGMLGRRSTEFDVLMQWVHVLRGTHWPGPTFTARDLYPAEGRNVITAGALKDPSWGAFLWVDSDHLPAPTFIERLGEYPADRAVIGGTYFGREMPFDLQAWESDPETEGLRQIHPLKIERMLSAPGLYPVGGVGTGWMLIQRGVLEQMADRKGPSRIWEVRGLTPDLEAELGLGLVLGEDVMFCQEVRTLLGLQVWLDTDPRMESAHLGTMRSGRREWAAAHLAAPGLARHLDAGALERTGHRVEVPMNRAQRRRLAR